MQMNEAMDEGDVLAQRAISISPTDTAETLTATLADLGATMLVDAVSGVKAGSLTPRPQEPLGVTLAPRIHKEMGRIDWRESAVLLERMVRSLQPWPRAYTTLGGKQLSALKARVHDVAAAGTPAPVGTVTASGPEGVVVATGAGLLVLEVVQFEGRRSLPIADFLRGHPMPPGTILGS